MAGKPDNSQQHIGFGNWVAVGRAIQREAGEIGLASSLQKETSGSRDRNAVLLRFDEAIDREAIRSASRELFRDGYYTQSVEEAFKCLNNTVKDKSGLTDQDGFGLMQNAFSANSPVLKLNDFVTSSEKNEQLGYMNIFAGAMAGIRNPRAHEHGIDDQPEIALELLILANHLMRRLEESTKAE